jgi:hypothetical protein
VLSLFGVLRNAFSFDSSKGAFLEGDGIGASRRKGAGATTGAGAGAGAGAAVESTRGFKGVGPKGFPIGSCVVRVILLKLAGLCKDFMPATIVWATFNIFSLYSIY